MAGEVSTPAAVVSVDGVAREARSVRVTREIATDLPAEVVGGGGMVAATGSVEWADDVKGVVSGRVDAPAKLAAVSVTAGMDGAAGSLFQRFTGVVDSSGGSASDAFSSSQIVDRSRSISRPVTLPTHLTQEVSAINQITSTGLSSSWFVHEVARQAGWAAYHFSAARTLLWAALAGSILPSSGVVPSFAASGDWDPIATPTGVGVAMSPGRLVDYTFDAPGASSGQSMEASLWCDPGVADFTVWTFYSKTSGVTALRGWAVYAYGGHVDVYEYNSTTGLGALLATASTTGWQPVGFHVSWSSSGWTVRLRTAAGVTATGFSADTTANARAAADEWHVYVGRDGGAAVPAAVAGLVVDRLPTATPVWAESVYVPRFRIFGDPADFQSWVASRLMFREDCLDTLKAVASAECAGLWVDEDGVLTYMSRQYMRNQALTHTYTSSTTLLDYNWSDNLDSLRSSCSVKHLLPAYAVRTTPNLTVWAGSSDQRFKANETTEQFVEPDALVDWWQPDLTISWGSVDTKPTVNSWWGGKVKVDSTDATVRTATSSDATVTATALGYQKMLLSFKANSIGAANYLDTMGTPVVRARGKVSWTEQTYTSTTVGPADAPALEHDAGWYVQTIGARTTLANYLAAVTNGSYPTLDNVQIVPDPTLRLGQRITIQDSHVKGWAFNAVVFRIDESWSDGQATMTLGLRVTTFNPDLAVTLAQLDERWAGANLTTFDAAHTGMTLTQLDAAPLT